MIDVGATARTPVERVDAAGRATAWSGRRARAALAGRCSSPAFEGWNDAADAAIGAAEWLTQHGDGATAVAHIDPEEHIDFQSRRPQVELVDGVTRAVDVAGERRSSRCTLRRARPRGAPRHRAELPVEVVLPRGARRRRGNRLRDGRDVRRAARRRPAHARGARHRHRHRPRADRAGSTSTHSRYEGPTGIVGVLHDACRAAGLARCRCGRRCRTTSRRRPTRRPAGRVLDGSAGSLGLDARPQPRAPHRRPRGGSRSTRWPRATTTSQSYVRTGSRPATTQDATRRRRRRRRLGRRPAERRRARQRGRALLRDQRGNSWARDVVAYSARPSRTVRLLRCERRSRRDLDRRCSQNARTESTRPASFTRQSSMLSTHTGHPGRPRRGCACAPAASLPHSMLEQRLEDPRAWCR